MKSANAWTPNDGLCYMLARGRQSCVSPCVLDGSNRIRGLVARNASRVSGAAQVEPAIRGAIIVPHGRELSLVRV